MKVLIQCYLNENQIETKGTQHLADTLKINQVRQKQTLVRIFLYIYIFSHLDISFIFFEQQ